MKMENVETLVKRSLENNTTTREDDNLLYIDVIKQINPAYINVNFLMTFMNARQMGLPAFESVSRARRKLQEKDESLKGSIENQRARDIKQMDMFEYGLKK